MTTRLRLPHIVYHVPTPLTVNVGPEVFVTEREGQGQKPADEFLTLTAALWLFLYSVCESHHLSRIFYSFLFFIFVCEINLSLV